MSGIYDTLQYSSAVGSDALTTEPNCFVIGLQEEFMAVRVLHVDDDPALLSFAVDYLEGEDERLTLETTTSGDEALELVAEQEIDCIVCDYEMPEMDGIEVLETVREEYRDLPFILFTGKGSEQVASEAINKGVTDYLQKGGPEQYEILAHRIENAVDKQRQEQRTAELRHRFEVVLETMDTVVFLKEPNGRYLLMNDACRDLLGVDPEQDVSELTDEDLFPPERIEQYQADDRHVVEAEEPIETEEIVPIADGGEQTRLTRKSPVYDQDRSVTAICGVSTDITEQKRRQRALKQYEEYLDHSPETVVILNEHAEVEYQSATADEIYDFNLQQIQGERATSYIHPDDRDRVLADIERVSGESRGPVVTEFRAQTADGEWVWFESRAYNYLGEEPIDGILVSARPITKRKETEQQLRKQRRFIQQALDSLNDLFYVLNADGSLRQWNDAVSAVTGYTGSEIESMRPVEFFPTEDREPIAEAVERTLTDGTARIEADILTADGQRIPHEFTGARLTDKDGNTTGMVGIGRDITERKEREKELVQYKTYVEETSDTIAVVGSDGTVKFHNTTIGGESEFSPFNAEGETGFDYVHPEDREQIIDLFTTVLEEETDEVTTELRVETTDDEWRWIEARGVNKLDDPDIEGIIVTSHDITERKEREQALTRERDRLDEFASVISHDLRNPLNVAAGRTELVAEECDSEHVSDVREALSRMEALIDDLLTLARQGESVGEREQIALTDAVSACWHNVETGDATITTDEATLAADRSRVTQALENLFRNAIEHGGESVTVTVGVLDDKRGFYVADDGPGIPEADREDVFDSGYTTSNDDTGFGLAIVSRICTAHSWNITATESENGGARFEITGVESIE